MRTGQRDNRGLSLVELVVVIAIMAVLVGVIGSSMILIPHGRSKKCIQSIHTALGETKVNSMAKADCHLEILQDSEGVWIVETVDGVSTKERIAPKGTPAVTYATSPGGSMDTDLNGAHTYVYYDRSSGAVDTTKTTFYGAKSGNFQVTLSDLTGKSKYENK